MNPILNEIGTVFIPVSDIEKARNWYCDLLGLPAEGKVLFGHLYIVPLKGINIVLDSKIFRADHIFKTPVFHFNTNNINEAFNFLKSKNVEVATEIEHDQWFNVTDPDGNHLMVCQC